MNMELMYYQALSEKLGWNDMLSHIAIPAIDVIINNHNSHVSDCTGDCINCPESTVDILVNYWNADDIFALLMTPDFLEYENHKDLFIALRSEIEASMRKGCSHQEAIAEWYK